LFNYTLFRKIFKQKVIERVFVQKKFFLQKNLRFGCFWFGDWENQKNWAFTLGGERKKLGGGTQFFGL
jgi:hypothetical protein